MPTVRVTLFEDPIEVPEDEVPVLRSQGLLVEEAPTAAVAPTTAVVEPQSAPTKKDPS